MVTAAILFATGLVSSLLGSLVGLGGGFVMIPILLAVFPNQPKMLAGTVLVAMIFNSISSVWGYARQKRIDFKSGALFAATGIPGSVLGAFAATRLSGSLFHLAFGGLMGLISLMLLFRPNRVIALPMRHTIFSRLVDREGRVFEYSYSGWLFGGVAFLVGFLSSLLGIGGGSIMVPTMVIFLGFPPHIAAASSMFMILLSSVVGGTTHALMGDVLWWNVLWLAPGAFLGGRLGSWIAPRISGVWLVRVLAVFMILVAVQLIVG